VNGGEELFDLLDRLRNRFYGKYRGTVTQVDDATWRIKAKVPAVLRDQETGWCMPCVPYAGSNVGFVFVPEVGAGVWIEFEGGDVSFPIWTGCYWRSGEQPADGSPTVKAIITKAGHKVLLDDDGETITVSDQNQNQLSFGSGGLAVERGGKKVLVSDSAVSLNDGAFEVT
jgi:phage baseplate assembly protein gpV